jgi:hypothetical protein
VTAVPIASQTKLKKKTPWRLILLEKPLIAQLLNNFSLFYGTRIFFTVLTRALQ